MKAMDSPLEQLEVQVPDSLEEPDSPEEPSLELDSEEPDLPELPDTMENVMRSQKHKNRLRFTTN